MFRIILTTAVFTILISMIQGYGGIDNGGNGGNDYYGGYKGYGGPGRYSTLGRFGGGFGGHQGADVYGIYGPYYNGVGMPYGGIGGYGMPFTSSYRRPSLTPNPMMGLYMPDDYGYYEKK